MPGYALPSKASFVSISSSVVGGVYRSGRPGPDDDAAQGRLPGADPGDGRAEAAAGQAEGYGCKSLQFALRSQKLSLTS